MSPAAATPDDPVYAFPATAAAHPRMFWLDGGGARQWSGRRSLVGWLDDDDVSLTYDASRREVWRHTGAHRKIVGDDIFAALEREIGRDDGDPAVSWVGYFGYACRPDLPASTDPTSTAPDAMWMRCPRQRVYFHDSGETAGGGVVVSPPRRVPPTVDGEYARAFDRIQDHLRRGNSYEVNLTYRRTVDADIDPATAYLRLRRINPAPYAGYLQHNGTHVLSSSPERFATIDRRRWVTTRPIKGTTPRGATVREDEYQAQLLRSDPRFRSENLMIVDLLRNDLSIVCEPGTVTVPELMQVETYPSVHQLVSTIRGHLRDGVGTVEALRALFPAGSMTGAPKRRTMEIIEAVESTPRGVYAGALGWISADGRADLGVVIRTLVATPGPPWRYTLGTGGAVTVRSTVDSEFAESRWKAERLLTALE